MFVGPVNDDQKQELLSRAAALVLPIQGSEAFTVVMIEAIANGCPVIGYRLYCIPELVTDGENGFLADSEDELIEKVRRVDEIDRHEVWETFRRQFSSAWMTKRYLDVYSELLLPQRSRLVTASEEQ